MFKLAPNQSGFKQPGNVKQENPSLVYRSTFARKVIKIIQANFSNEQFYVTTLAQKNHLSVSQLNRKLKALVGQPAGQLIWEMKMDHAAGLLLDDELSIGQIGGMVGYSTQAHFCRSFKKKYQCTPTQFRDQHRKQSGTPFS